MKKNIITAALCLSAYAIISTTSASAASADIMSGKTPVNGFSKDTVNFNYLEMLDYWIPDYYTFMPDNSDSTYQMYVASLDGHSASAYASFQVADAGYAKADFINNEDNLLMQMGSSIPGTNIGIVNLQQNLTIADLPAATCTYMYTNGAGEDLLQKKYVMYNEYDGNLYLAECTQPLNSSSDFFSDFDQVMACSRLYYGSDETSNTADMQAETKTQPETQPQTEAPVSQTPSKYCVQVCNNLANAYNTIVNLIYSDASTAVKLVSGAFAMSEWTDAVDAFNSFYESSDISAVDKAYCQQTSADFDSATVSNLINLGINALL